jgi:predicted ATPase
VRLLTLTGPPGAGKTRLAVVVATQVASAFSGQTVFVPLATIADAAGVPATIARALGLSEAEGWTPLESLKRRLKDEHLLLILDNLEQVVAAAPAVAELLAVCPRLVVLGTSREPLGVRGEQQFSLEPLPQEEALRLFVDRARAVQPGFMLAPDNSAAVAEICQRLDGLPLAIELAAARIKVFPPAAIRDRLSSRGGGLTLLGGRARDALPHQQTLFDAIAWSYALLEDNEKKLFRRLGVFVGGFEAEAAEAVCPGTTWETVASLVDKSLVQPDPCLDRPAARFAMLETIREYALAQLAPAGEGEEALDRHAAYHLDLVESADRDRRGGRGAGWPERLERAQPDLRAVLRRALDRGEAARALRLAAALAPFWQDRGHYQEGRAWLVEVLDRPTARAPELRSFRAQAAIGAGWLAFRQGDHAVAGEMFDEAVALADLDGDRGAPAEARLGLGQVRQAGGDYGAAEALLEAGLAEYRGLDDALGAAHALFLIGMLASRRAEFESARTLLGESLTLARRAVDKSGIARTLGALALLAFQQGDHAGARALYEEGLAFDRELGDRRAAAWRQLSLGRVLHAQGDRAGARQMNEEATATLRELGERTREAPPG